MFHKTGVTLPGVSEDTNSCNALQFDRNQGCGNRFSVRGVVPSRFGSN
jgi:hypothetical protein